MYDELVKDLRENHDKYFARDMQAADAIEELSKPKWVPVTERLPEPGQDVLVALGRGEIAIDYYQPDRLGYRDVTHWMPLPELPKEET